MEERDLPAQPIVRLRNGSQ